MAPLLLEQRKRIHSQPYLYLMHKVSQLYVGVEEIKLLVYLEGLLLTVSWRPSLFGLVKHEHRGFGGGRDLLERVVLVSHLRSLLGFLYVMEHEFVRLGLLYLRQRHWLRSLLLRMRLLFPGWRGEGKLVKIFHILVRLLWLVANNLHYFVSGVVLARTQRNLLC